MVGVIHVFHRSDLANLALMMADWGWWIDGWGGFFLRLYEGLFVGFIGESVVGLLIMIFSSYLVMRWLMVATGGWVYSGRWWLSLWK